MEIDPSIVMIAVIGGMASTLFIRLLNFLVKSRCETIKCCWGGLECNRSVVSEQALDKNIIKDTTIEIPSNLVNVKK